MIKTYMTSWKDRFLVPGECYFFGHIYKHFVNSVIIFGLVLIHYIVGLEACKKINLSDSEVPCEPGGIELR